MARDEQGFSLIELLIVVAIILVIAAIAIPNLLRSRIAANQASAIESCRMINTAEVAYYTSYGVGYSSSLIQLAPPAAGALASPSAAGYLDSVLGWRVQKRLPLRLCPHRSRLVWPLPAIHLERQPVATGSQRNFVLLHGLHARHSRPHGRPRLRGGFVSRSVAFPPPGIEKASLPRGICVSGIRGGAAPRVQVHRR